MNKQIRILLLEDNYSDAELVRRALRKAGFDFTLEWARDKPGFLKTLEQCDPDLALLDYSLPGFDGLTALALTRQRFTDIPVIIVSGAIGEEVAIESLKAGATDYVLKQRLGRLGSVVQRALQEAEQLSERKRAQEALRESEARFRLLSETSGRLLTSQDPQGIVEELCRQVMAHLDCHAFFNFLVDEQEDRFRLNTWAGISQEEASRIEWVKYEQTVCGCTDHECRAGVAEDIRNTPDSRTELIKRYGIQAYACHPMMVQGRLIGTLSFGTKTRPRFLPEELDLMKTVTDQVATAMERMRLIAELHRSRDELEQRVQERTAELERLNEELVLYTTLLEQSNRELEDFVHVASHDLQEPLRKIQTFADWLVSMRQESLDTKTRDYLKRMQRATGRMQALILDLLRYSRVTSKPGTTTLFNLREAAEEAAADLKPFCEETQGHIEIGELPEVEADRVQMRQLFRNLMSNSLKYRGWHKPLISVYTHSSCACPFWEIHVRDNGIGFDELYLDKIFKPFQRLHGKHSPYAGTGMGLSICRKIVEHHGGSITARSKPGEGATFIVKLPKKQLRLEKTD